MKKFDLNEDVVYADSYIGEHIRILSSSMSRKGSSPSFTPITEADKNIKRFNHWFDPPFSGGFFQTIYDRDVLRIESIPLIDVSFGVSVSSSLAGKDAFFSGNAEFSKQKIRNYKLFSQILLGNSNKLFQINNQDQHELMFINIRRNQFKDKMSPGTIRIESIYSGSVVSVLESRVFTDKLSNTSTEDTFGGQRGSLTPNISGIGVNTLTGSELSKIAGHVYYQHGIIVLIPSVFSNITSTIGNHWWVSGALTGNYDALVRTNTGSNVVLENLYSSVRQRILQIDFRNYSKIKSTFYNCVAETDEFNYSSNPSFKDLEGSIIPVSGNSGFQTVTYLTKIGLLGNNNEVLAVGSLSRPIKKDPKLRIEVKVRLDY